MFNGVDVTIGKKKWRRFN